MCGSDKAKTNLLIEAYFQEHLELARLIEAKLAEAAERALRSQFSR